ncbi:response regulator [Vibrio paucivorans]
MKILIVDDSKATVEIIRRALEAFDYRRLTIQTAENGVKALEIVESWHPDIVLTDWYMPEKSGLELTKEIMQLNQGIKVAMLTTVDDPPHIKQAENAWALFVLSKPFDDEALHRELRPLVYAIEQGLLDAGEGVEVHEELALPKLTQLEKLLKKAVGDGITLKAIPQQPFDETKVPCLMAIYADPDTQKPRAVALLDMHAICVMAQGSSKISPQQLKQALGSQTLSNEMAESCQKVLEASSLAFLDNQTRKSLKLKNVSFVAKAFDKLEVLYGKGADKRIDFSCELKGFEAGKITLVGF